MTAPRRRKIYFGFHTKHIVNTANLFLATKWILSRGNDSAWAVRESWSALRIDVGCHCLADIDVRPKSISFKQSKMSHSNFLCSFNHKTHSANWSLEIKCQSQPVSFVLMIYTMKMPMFSERQNVRFIFWLKIHYCNAISLSTFLSWVWYDMTSNHIHDIWQIIHGKYMISNMYMISWFQIIYMARKK